MSVFCQKPGAAAVRVCVSPERIQEGYASARAENSAISPQQAFAARNAEACSNTRTTPHYSSNPPYWGSSPCSGISSSCCTQQKHKRSKKKKRDIPSAYARDSKLIKDCSTLSEEGLTPDSFNVFGFQELSARKCVLCEGDHSAGLEVLRRMTLHSEGEESDCGSDGERPFRSNATPSELLIQREEADDPHHVWLSPHPLQGVRSKGCCIYVHRLCALYSPQTVLEHRTWYNVAKEVCRSRQLSCKICAKRGASVGCANKSCKSSVHFPCAVLQGWMPSSFAASASPFYCVVHMRSNRNSERVKDSTAAEDLARGREPVVVHLREEARSILQSDFVYLTEPVDSDDVYVPRNPRALQCCTCTDACTDVNRCECLQRVHRKAYSMQGTLMDFWPRVVWECNSGCACNKNTCGNRAVGRGMTLNIEVGCVTNAHQQGGDQEWAVFAGESIIKGTFVCEVAGQLVSLNKPPCDSRRYILRLAAHDGELDAVIDSEGNYVCSKRHLPGTYITVSTPPTKRCAKETLREMQQAHELSSTPNDEVLFLGVSKGTGLSPDSPVVLSDASDAEEVYRPHVVKEERFEHWPCMNSQSDLQEDAGQPSNPARADQNGEGGDDRTLWIDMKSCGNVARFIRRGTKASANLEMVRVYTEVQDKRFPRLALFTSRPIEQGQELLMH